MKIQIDDASWSAFKKVTKEKGMTIQGHIGKLIMSELQQKRRASK